MAVKIRLKRMGKKFAPFYRVVVLDSRKKRDGRVIEEVGVYDPMQEPSLIKIDGERAKYWLGVGAQPSDAVLNLLKITGDWQAFKGLPGAEGTLKVKEVNVEAAEAAIKAAADEAEKRKAAVAEAKAKEEAEKKAAEEAAAAEAAAESTEEAAEASEDAAEEA
ncbi:30S ribosomal protein S16 [Actinomyces vulturis]|uniref:30S ribosomal protein S16 n=1 Tax=Actinomyces vulturis TaxID=1857645 RepID=UPI0008358B27|nr:30S ribosomal protein S16 [Actinomyces vulturis]